MIIGIDGNEANINSRVGVGQYAYNLLNSLSLIKSNDKFIIYLKNKPLADMPLENSNWQYHVFGPKKFWTRLSLPMHLIFQNEKLDVFYSPNQYLPLICPFKSVATIHDLGYLKFPQQFTKKDFYQLNAWTKESIKKASKLITVSQFTKDEVHKTYHYPLEKIYIAYNGVTPPQTIKKTNLKIPQKYFLYIGTLKPNKNIPYLLDAFATTKDKYLIIAGKKGWLYEEIFSQVKKLNLEKRVIFTGFITEEDKWYLYQNAIATIIPSLYEGFGIPAIESQIIGTPVIASNIKVFQEILGSSAILTDNLSKTLNSPINKKYKKLGKINAQKFTWNNTALSVLKCLYDVKNNK